MSARDRLDRALLDLAERGARPPCGHRWSGDLWVSDDAEDRARAAVLCRPCLLLEECAAAGDERREAFGVWGGVDRTKRPTRKKEKRDDQT